MKGKFDEMLSALKVNELLHRKDSATKRKNVIICVLAVIGAVAAVAAIAYAVYRYMNPDYLEDFDDDFDDYEEDEDDVYDSDSPAEDNPGANI